MWSLQNPSSSSSHSNPSHKPGPLGCLPLWWSGQDVSKWPQCALSYTCLPQSAASGLIPHPPEGEALTTTTFPIQKTRNPSSDFSFQHLCPGQTLPVLHLPGRPCLRPLPFFLQWAFTTAHRSFCPEVIDKIGFQQILPRAWSFISAEAFYACQLVCPLFWAGSSKPLIYLMEKELQGGRKHLELKGWTCTASYSGQGSALRGSPAWPPGKSPQGKEAGSSKESLMDDSTPAGDNKVMQKFFPRASRQTSRPEEVALQFHPWQQTWLPSHRARYPDWQHRVSLTLLKPAHQAVRPQIPSWPFHHAFLIQKVNCRQYGLRINS